MHNFMVSCRKFSYILTIPLLNCNIHPNTISILSIVFVYVGLFVSLFIKTVLGAWLVLFSYAIWGLLDGVDGNLARYKSITSEQGHMLDATSGYLAMFSTFMSAGVISSNVPQLNTGIWLLDSGQVVALGAIAGAAQILPRLIMNKKIAVFKNSETVNEVKNKQSYRTAKLLIVNMISVSGLAWIFFALSVIFHCIDLYVYTYFLLNSLVFLGSTFTLLK